MKNVLTALLLSFVAACSSTEPRSRPLLASSEVVVLSHQPAEEVAAMACGILHGAPLDANGVPTIGCSSLEHRRAHRHEDGSTHISMTADPRSNTIVLAAPPGHDADLARAVALLRELDAPTVGWR